MSILMVQGTSSSAGKSLLVTALCRIFARRGVNVAPFKAQNMSNNAGVCADGSEIGRAQITQAIAAGIDPTPLMNPVLIKPEGNMRSQIIVNGRPWQTLSARTYFEKKRMLWGEVTAALDQLRAQHDLVIIEGAGSPVELNLKQGDIVNMAVARYANAPVLLVGDIDRGGIFAQLLGTQMLFDPEEQALLAGFIVNKFRGDPTLFEDGITMLEARSGKPVFGVVPWLTDLNLPDEDAAELTASAPDLSQNQIEIVVIRLPRIANFDEFDALNQEPGVTVRFVDSVAQLGNPAAIILPGTKSTMADLAWLKARGLADAICRMADGDHEHDVAIVGICGGYQMLGRTIADPDHIESAEPHCNGLGLLRIDTMFAGDKQTTQTTATINQPTEMRWLTQCDPILHGYEIHMGRTTSDSAWLHLSHRGEMDGAMGGDGRIWGCYLHGLFENSAFRHAWLRSLGWREQIGHDQTLDDALNRLADHVESHLDLDQIQQLIE